MTEEHLRLVAERREGTPWHRWGPYLSERQWGTVREDNSPGGDAWNYLTHDAARAWAYRWGEDGLAGVCDDHQLLCFALALWNGRDPILKERLYGLTNSEGNHGEDVKEYYFYLDSTPTHSYMKYLYKYPQAAFPYTQLVNANRARSRNDMEYELMDTGVFDGDRYFDVFVEYAKSSPEDLLIEINVWNRGPEPASLAIVPQLWFRHVWPAQDGAGASGRPVIRPGGELSDAAVLVAQSPSLGMRYLYCQPGAELLFTDNETNAFRFPDQKTDARYYKDAFHYYVCEGNRQAVNPERLGSKAGACYRAEIPPGGSASLRLRLSDATPESLLGGALGPGFARVFQTRRSEADQFYEQVIPGRFSDDQRLVTRQALAGMLWTKQYYDYDVALWLSERGVNPYGEGARGPRNGDWHHMVNGDVISMPDKWEYPWYAAWDLAFHTLPLGLVDSDFAKRQLTLLLDERYIHPSGQVPAYEWNFSDVNPPVHAWAAYFLYQQERVRTGVADTAFLRNVYHKLLLNFTWWVNRKDPSGRNVFEGGFLGLDNIGVFDRSAPLPTGGHLEQADGTAWMAFYCQMMLQISLELALEDPAYEGMALKFFEHFVWIAGAMTHGRAGMWDEEDGFFYDVLCSPDGGCTRLKVRSMVGLLPLCAATVVNEHVRGRMPALAARAAWFVNNRHQLVDSIHDPRLPGVNDRRLLSVLGEDRLRRVLACMLDEREFLSPYGIRSLSAHHRDHPYTFWAGGQELRVGYLPAESDSGMFGGNSNWRGPIWMPMNALLIRALYNYYAYYGDDFKVECPTGSGRYMTLYQVAQELTRRLAGIFLRNEAGHRPVFGGTPKFRDDPLWRDHVLFFEYFHGDNGAGIGASHQTGWTGLIASLMTFAAVVAPDQLMAPPPGYQAPHPVPGGPQPGAPRPAAE
jgi:hypothetical protein